MISQDITRKIKTDGEYFGLQHTFGKSQLSLQNDRLIIVASQEENQTRIKLLDSFQQSYLAKSDIDRSQSQSVLSREPIEPANDKTNNDKLNKLRDELYRNMVESETRKCLVEMQRTVNEYLLERLRLYKDRSIAKAGVIKMNRVAKVPDASHLTSVAKEYLKAAIDYDKKLGQLTDIISTD